MNQIQFLSKLKAQILLNEKRTEIKNQTLPYFQEIK